MNPFEFMTKIPGLKGLIDQAPKLLVEYLNKVLVEYRAKTVLQPEEKKMYYIMYPISKEQYNISIITATADDKRVRTLFTTTLGDLLSIIFSQTKEDE